MESPRAISFIEVTDRRGFRVTPEALSFLSSIKKPLAVVSVAGKYRTGKSFLLNRILLNRQTGFGVGPTINACTKGIWIWSEPIMLETVDGEECALVLLDTEGLGALDEDANHDTRIFLLALLLASNFIYNSIGSLDEAALSNLSLIVNLTKQLQVHSTASQPDVDEMSTYFPSLLWVLRDFALQLIDKSGNEISPKDYLENALTPQKGVSDNVEQKNRIRRYIKHFFKERDCFPLVRPSESEEVLQTLETIEDNALRPEFLTQMNQLRKFVLRKAKVKVLNGKKVTGDMLGSLAVAYVQAINAGTVPNIDSAWNYMCQSECQRLTDNGLSDFQNKLTGLHFPEQVQTLKEKYKLARDDIILTFRQQAVGPQINLYEKDLKVKLRAEYQRVKVTNERAIGVACEETFSKFYQDTLEKLKKGEYTQFLTFKRDLDSFINEFRKGTLKGVTAEKKVNDFTERILSEASDYIQRNTNQEAQNQQRRLNQLLELAQAQLNQKKEEHNRETEDLKTRLDRNSEETNSLKAQIMTLTLQLEEQQRERQRLEDRHRERQEELKRDQSDRTSDLKQRLDSALREISEMQGKHSKEISLLEKEKALLEQELRFRKEECEELKNKRTGLETEAKKMRGELRTLRENRTEDREGNEAALKSEISDLREQLLQAQKSVIEDTSESLIQEKEGLRLMEEGSFSQSSKNRDEILESVESKFSLEPAEIAPMGKRRFDDSIKTSKPVKTQEEIQSPNILLENQRLKTELLTLKKQFQALSETKEKEHSIEIARLKSALGDVSTTEKAVFPRTNTKEITQKSVGVVCRFCGQVVVHQYFSGHVEECIKTYEARTSVNPDLVLISVPQTVTDRRGEEKFVISCKRGERVWVVQRSLDAFRKLQAALDDVAPEFPYPPFGATLRSSSESIYSPIRALSPQAIQRELERYLSAIANTSPVSQFREVQQFLG